MVAAGVMIIMAPHLSLSEVHLHSSCLNLHYGIIWKSPTVCHVFQFLSDMTLQLKTLLPTLAIHLGHSPFPDNAFHPS